MRVLHGEQALRGQADEALAALDERRAELLLELLDRRRQRRLRDAASRGRAPKMLFAGERDEVGELSEHHGFDNSPCFGSRPYDDSSFLSNCAAPLHALDVAP